MIELQFKKERAERYLQCLFQGKAIGPPEGRDWTTEEVLALAGACQYLALVNAQVTSEHVKGPLGWLPNEQRGAAASPLQRNIEDAVRFCAWLAKQVATERYDQSFDPVCRVTIEGGPGRRRAVPKEGMRLPPQDLGR